VTVRIPWWQPVIGAAEYDLVRGVLESGYINDGATTRELEARLAERLGVKHAVAVTSGTAALHLSLVGLGVGPGDEVLVPDLTFVATANAVTLAGATPVPVDVEAGTLNLDPERAARAITPRTRAVVPVHVSGRSADMPAILALARRHGLRVVEDAAEALLSRLDGRCLGTFGDAGCFSFSPMKKLTTGQGGLVVTDDDRLHVRLRELKDQGRPVQGTGGDDVVDRVGFNSKLTNLQAAVGLGQLSALDARVEGLNQTYRRYARGLEGVDGIALVGFRTERGESPQWVDALSERRDPLLAHLLAQGIECRKFWLPLHRQAPYRAPDDAFPVSSRLFAQAFWLPSAPTLGAAEIDAVCGQVREFLAGRPKRATSVRS
jgi:perosamine synthetase